jgi:hypothetical protein
LLNKKFTLLRIIAAAVVGIFLFTYLLFLLPWVQNRVAHRIASSFSKTIGAPVELGQVRFSLFDKLDVQNILIRDENKDTLFYTESLKLRLSDLYLSNNTPIIKYIGLVNTKLYLNRKTAKWNYQFILDQLNKTADSNQKNTEFDLKKLDISNFQFISDDQWVGNKTILSSTNILVNIKSMNGKNINIDQLIANKPYYLIQNKEGLNPIKTVTKNVKRKKGELYFNNSHLQIFANEIKVINGKMWIENGFSQPISNFDVDHIRMKDINANIRKVSFIEDTIKATVSLRVKEQSGFEIKKLSTQFRMTPEIMEFNKLLLKTNNSSIGSYYAMQYKDLANDFPSYIDKVTMKAHLVNANVAFDDIAYFAPSLQNIHQKVNTSFHFLGTVANFETKDFTASYNKSTLSGNLSMKGIPDMRNTEVKFTSVVASANYNDISNWIPSLLTKTELNVNSLGAMNFKGEFNGSLYDFVTKGQISTELGVAKTEIRLQFPAKKEPSYEGLLETNRFNIGKFLNNDLIGLVNFKGSIAGSSFSLDNIKTNIQGDIDSIEVNKYIYTHISTKGILQKKAFIGLLGIKDENVNFTSNLNIDFNEKRPKIVAVSDLHYANLKALNISKNDIQLAGKLDLNFEGDSIDNFIGYAKFYKGNLKGETSSLDFDSLTLASSIQNGIKKITLSSEDIKASITGKFNIINLPSSVQYFMQRYFPTYINAPKNAPTNQDFTFQIKTNYFEPYLRLFKKEISGFNNLTLEGSLNSAKQNISLVSSIPFASWDSYLIKNGKINGTGTKDSVHVNIIAAAINITDSTQFLQPNISVHSSNDHSNFSAFALSKSALEEIMLKGMIQTYNDGISIKWQPSYFILNQKKWDINNLGSLILRKNNVNASNLTITQGIQEFVFSNSTVTENALQLELKNIILGDFTKVFFSYPKLEGITNGKIQFKNILTDFELDANLKLAQFRFNADSIGLAELSIGYQNSTGKVPFNLNCPNTEYNLAAIGSYNIKNDTSPLDATLYMRKTKFSLVEQFIGGVITHLDGKANGAIHFGGRIENPYLLGSASLDKASFIVDYTKVRYFIDSSIINFNNEGIDFGTVGIRDSKNRKAVFKGKILNQGFKHLEYDMEMSSPKIELLNTNAIDNASFYGQAVGKAGMTIKGPEENIKMFISADVNDSAHIYLPNSTSKESGKSDFIVFKKYGKTAKKNADIPAYNLVVDLEVTANNKTKIDLILDELTGDVIKAVGNGRLKIRAGNIEPLTIRGKYNIESGKYDFNFQSFIKKPFDLIPEAGNFIEWTGDPYEADLHIDARYTAERISLNELVGTGNFSNAVRTYRGGVYVIAGLRNKLSKPDIKFSLAFPPGNPISTDNEFSQFISRLERDENEILKQVSFLIVFNSFAPVSFSNSNNSNAYTVTTIGINTISNLLTKEINKSVTNILNKVTGDRNLRFDIGSSVYNSANLIDPSGAGLAINANKIDRQRVNLKLGRSFLNDNIIVNVGGDLDFNVRNTTSIQNGTFQWLPDLNIEFILTRDRKLRAIVFNRNSLDITGSSLGRRNRQGLSISYRKDFDSLF